MMFEDQILIRSDKEGNLFLKILFFVILFILLISGYFATNYLIVTLIIIGSVLSVWMAYYYPIFTIVLLILFGQIIQFELIEFLQHFEALPLGTLNLRFSDPIIFGIVVTFLIKGLNGDKSTKKLFSGQGRFFSIFLLFVLIQLFRNYNIYGSYSFGEFRTYYQGLIIMPYIAVSIKTHVGRYRLFTNLTYLALIQILIGVIKGGAILNFSLDTYEKWLSSFGSLALLYGLFAFYLLRKYKCIKLPGFYSSSIFFIGFIVLIIASNRSVWLAGTAAFTFLILIKEIHVKHHIALFFISIFVFLTVTQVFTSEGYDFYNFFTERLYAFTDFKKDPTSAWRYYVWMSMIENIKAQPFLGYGLGGNFNIYIPEFASFFGNSPHNFYLAMLYELGLVGLLIFFVFLIKFVKQLNNIKPVYITDHLIKVSSFIVIISLLSYWVAYSTEKDFFSWAFLGLGFSIVINSNNRKNMNLYRIDNEM